MLCCGVLESRVLVVNSSEKVGRLFDTIVPEKDLAAFSSIGDVKQCAAE